MLLESVNNENNIRKLRTASFLFTGEYETLGTLEG